MTALTYPQRVKADTTSSAVIVSSRQEISNLASGVKHLLDQRDPNAGPAFFSASIESQSWIPRVVVVRRGMTIRGLLYAKERKLGGFPTGLVYADSTLDYMVLAAAGDTAEVLKIAVACLLRDQKIRGLRMLIPGDHSFDVFLQELKSQGNLDLQSVNVQHHCILDLTDDYNTFLARLGKTTRRNFRYYRRHSEADGNQFVPEMNLQEFRSAAMSLLRKGVVGADGEGLERALGMVAAADRRMLAGLRAPNGDWLAIVGGWYESRRAVIFCQMNNDRDYPQKSLCNVLRGYLFESLIARSFTRVLFWAGIGEPLLRHCEIPPTTAIYVDRATFFWRSFRRVLAVSAKFLPERIGYFVRWISPPLPPKSE